MITIKQIAKLAEVSEGTVDRVIHNRPGVSQKTKDRVQQIIKKHNFQKNIIASTLASKKTLTIATLIPQSKSNKEFWFEPDRGIKTAIDEIKKFGIKVHCFYFDLFNPDSFVNAFKELLAVKPDGVVLAPVFYSTSKKLIGELEEKSIPYLLINVNLKSQKNISFIGQNSYQSGFLSAKIMNLILQENDEILILKYRENIETNQSLDLRVEGFFDYFKKNKISKNIKLIILDDFNATEIKKHLSKEKFGKGFIYGIFVSSTYGYTIAQYLDKNNLNNVRLIAYDVSANNAKYLQSHIIDFLIDQEPFNQGYMGLKTLFDYLFFNITPNLTYNSPVNIITKENMEFMN